MIPLRTRGLQIHSAVTVGNTIYAAVALLFTAALMVMFSGDGPLKHSQMWGWPDWIGHIVVWAVLVTVVYYACIDWYDVHLVPYFDEEFTRLNLCLWLLGGLMLGAVIVSAIWQHFFCLGMLTAIYVPIAINTRDEQIQLAPTLDQAFIEGVQRGTRKERWRWITCITAMVLAGLVVWATIKASGCAYDLAKLAGCFFRSESRWQSWPSLKPWIAGMSLLLWLLGAYIKFRRSKDWVEPLYSAAIKRILSEPARP